MDLPYRMTSGVTIRDVFKIGSGTVKELSSSERLKFDERFVFYF